MATEREGRCEAEARLAKRDGQHEAQLEQLTRRMEAEAASKLQRVQKQLAEAERSHDAEVRTSSVP